MKITVSIPDELWLAVRREGEPSSTTVQEGLRLLSGARDPEHILNGLHADADQVDPLISRFRDEAERRLTLGRQVGVDFAERLSWAELELLPNTETALASKLRNEFVHSDPNSSELIQKLDDAFNSWGDELSGVWDDDGNAVDSPTLFEGIAQVLCAFQQTTAASLRAGQRASSPPEASDAR